MKNFLKKILNNFKKEYQIKTDIQVNFSDNNNHGDFSTNIALVAAQTNKKNPKEIANEITNKLKRNEEVKKYFKMEIAGHGFINFFLKNQAIKKTLNKIVKDENYFKNNKLNNKKIIVEYGHPNPFKSFHIGHLRTLIIGESIVRLLENAGAKVIRANYQGDVGLHVAKFFWGFHNNKKTISEYLNNKNKSILENKVNYLADCYVLGAKVYGENKKAKEEIHEYNKKIYNMDPEIKTDWEKMRSWSLEKFDQIYNRLNSKFDKLYFESEMAKPAITLCNKAYKKGILSKDDNCLIFKGEKYGLNNRVFINKLGLPTYEGKEIALAFKEFTDFEIIDKVIHVVASEQNNFFKVTFKVQKLMDKKLFDNKQEHVSYGMVQTKGVKMSSRLGNIVLGEDIIDQAKNKIKKIIKTRELHKLKNKEIDQISEDVAISAVKYSFLKIGHKKDILFDLDQSVNLEGQSGPYILYSYVRAKNILKKIKSNKNYLKKEIDIQKINKIEKRIIMECGKTKYIIENALKEYKISLIAEHSYNLANAFSNFYDKCKVLNESDKNKKNFKLKIVAAFIKAQKKCIDILGFKAIEKM